MHDNCKDTQSKNSMKRIRQRPCDNDTHDDGDKRKENDKCPDTTKRRETRHADAPKNHQVDSDRTNDR
jgi:hypothetical protein